jgi:methionyl-tRNA formyltransferase
MGTSAFALPSLRALARAHHVATVITQPDRPRGRGQTPAPPPVKEEAERLGLPVVQPDRLGAEEVAELLASAPEVIVVAAYGKLLPPALLNGPRHGCINVHASLLPRLRGAAPIVWAIARGDRETGVSIMRMDEGLDSGPVLLRRAVEIGADETSGALEARLAELGAAALIEALAGVEAGTLAAQPQDAGLATRAPKVGKQDARVAFDVEAPHVRDLVRAMDPRPAAWATIDGGPLRLFRPRVVDGAGEPGRVLGASADGLIVACASGAVAFGELQLPGRKRLPAADVLRGRPIPAGVRLS